MTREDLSRWHSDSTAIGRADGPPDECTWAPTSYKPSPCTPHSSGASVNRVGEDRPRMHVKPPEMEEDRIPEALVVPILCRIQFLR